MAVAPMAYWFVSRPRVRTVCGLSSRANLPDSVCANVCIGDST